MEPHIRNNDKSIISKIKENPRGYSFDMLAFVLNHENVYSFGKEPTFSARILHTKNINVFYLRATEIEKVTFPNYQKPIIYTQRLSIAGLNAPLPTPYAELMHDRMREQDLTMLEFFDIFHSRLLGISYQINKKKYLSLHKKDEKNLLLETIYAFFGNDEKFCVPRISRLAYLFWAKEKSAHGLEVLLHLILQSEIKVHQFLPKKIRKAQLSLLGKSNNKLNVSAELGKEVSILCRIMIDITLDNFSKVKHLTKNGKYKDYIKLVIKKYIGNFTSCVLNIIPTTNVQPPILGRMQLGTLSWLCFDGTTKFDGKKVEI